MLSVSPSHNNGNIFNVLRGHEGPSSTNGKIPQKRWDAPVAYLFSILFFTDGTALAAAHKFGEAYNDGDDEDGQIT